MFQVIKVPASAGMDMEGENVQLSRGSRRRPAIVSLNKSGIQNIGTNSINGTLGSSLYSSVGCIEMSREVRLTAAAIPADPSEAAAFTSVAWIVSILCYLELGKLTALAAALALALALPFPAYKI